MSRTMVPVPPSPASQLYLTPRDHESDLLTGLPDRRAFARSLGSALATDRSPVGVVVLDLDRFRAVRTSLGPAAGDELLGAVAGRLDSCIRHSDVLARLSSDRFAVLVRGSDQPSDAGHLAARIIDRFRRPFAIRNLQVLLRASVGVAAAGEVRKTPESLMRNAELAVGRAKAEGGDRWSTFDAPMHALALAHSELEAELRVALERGQLSLEFQPQVYLLGPQSRAGTIRRVEALLRWRHPVRGVIAPAEFLPVAEETGLIVPIGSWVLREALDQAVRWQQLEGHADLGVAVNLSPRQVAHPGSVGEIAAALRHAPLAPGSLVVEITEGALQGDTEAVGRSLAAMRHAGARVALDDFGSGPTPLSQISGVELDVIKIDRGLITRAVRDGAHETAVRTLIQLGRAMGLETVAMGVETNGQVAALRSLGCELAQGYLFGKPLGPEGITALLRAERRRLGEGQGTLRPRGRVDA